MYNADIGRDVHKSLDVQSIAQYIDVDRSNMVCFRCGETGHVRFQCLTYKVKECKAYSSPSGCNDKKCPYAHGGDELRTPWTQKCIRVIKQNGRYTCIGCYSTDHTFRKCPFHENMIIV